MLVAQSCSLISEVMMILLLSFFCQEVFLIMVVIYLLLTNHSMEGKMTFNFQIYYYLVHYCLPLIVTESWYLMFESNFLIALRLLSSSMLEYSIFQSQFG